MAILFENAGASFHQELVWEEAGAVLFGGGNKVWVLSVEDGSVLAQIEDSNGSYFGSMKLAPARDALFVATATICSPSDSI